MMPIKKSSIQRGRWRGGMWFLLTIISTIAILIVSPSSQSITKENNYTIHQHQTFNQPQFYPLSQTVDSQLYQPVAEWVGRLILPTPEQIRSGSDWVWLEVQVAPLQHQNLVGKVLRLEWQDQPEIKSYLKAVKRDVHFTQDTKSSIASGIVNPQRLDGRLQVGPLHSLAGARPHDNVIVGLNDVKLLENVGTSTLQIDHEPVQVTGRFYGLVKILNPEITSSRYPASPVCPGKLPCPSDFFQVRHYNPISQNFDGVLETIRIPQQVFDSRNIPPSTPRQLETSPAGKAGWYIYGAQDAQGIFVVQGIAPRSLFQLQSEQRIFGQEPGIKYIKQQNWQFIDKGTIRKVLLEPQTSTSTGWKPGDQALLIHTFGGIGGQKGETISGYTVTGHFAFGLALVVRDPFTQELQFSIQYQQVYAHNPDGIIAGKQSWTEFMGNLQRGWVATRPTSDVLIKYAPVTEDYDFGGIKLSPLGEFLKQLQVMMARYRVGDGTGNATVTPATSCVQDSSQALYITIKAIQQQVVGNPSIQQWLTNHPQDEQTLRFQKLISLGADLERQLTPLRIVRADWEHNAEYLTGIGNTSSAVKDGSIWAGLSSWQTMMPRLAQDELATLFFKHGAKLWFLRTNQIGGWNPDIIPLAPTGLLGQITIPLTNLAPIPGIFQRLLLSLALPQPQDWLIVGVILFIYGAIALPFGFRSGFLHFSFTTANWWQQLQIALKAAIFPALSEELCFRVLPLAHPIEVINWQKWGLWAAFMISLFIFYHPFNAKTFFKAGIPTFFDPIFLTLAGFLGLTCTVAYAMTGSLWAIAFIHWMVVVVWLLGLGGLKKLTLHETTHNQA